MVKPGRTGIQWGKTIGSDFGNPFYHIPWKSKDYFLNGFSVKTIVLVGIYNQQFKGTILFLFFDFQGI